jgi:hypothetical protein
MAIPKSLCHDATGCFESKRTKSVFVIKVALSIKRGAGPINTPKGHGPSNFSRIRRMINEVCIWSRPCGGGHFPLLQGCNAAFPFLGSYRCTCSLLQPESTEVQTYVQTQGVNRAKGESCSETSYGKSSNNKDSDTCLTGVMLKLHHVALMLGG